MAARVALLTPYAAPSVRGNAITVDRVTRGLRQRGVELRVWDLSVVPEGAVDHQISQYRPAVIHANTNVMNRAFSAASSKVPKCS